MMAFLSQHLRELLSLVREHLLLVLLSTGLAVAVGLPVGVLLTRRPGLRRPVLGLANVLQTVPSLALFGLLMPLPLVGGIGIRAAVIALVLYALLPVIRNTATGIEGVDRNVREAALAMGMTDWQILWQVELPLAASVILAGVRVAVVISVGVATIAAAIGAGGLGTYIFRGLRMNDNRLILLGAVPAALLALLADSLIGLLESRIGHTRARRLPGGSLALVLGALCIATCGYAMFHAAGALARGKPHNPVFLIGSKDYTEQVILGELIAQTLEARGIDVERRFELGGSLCHEALVAGQIDAYPEYTGTAYTVILHHPPLPDPRLVHERIRREYADRFALEVGPPLGFRNDFAILVRGADARRLGLRTLSESARYTPGWHAGFGQDFMSRPDGYPGFAKTYGLRFADRPKEMDLSLTYRALASGEIDLIAGNSTDGLVAALDLFQLEDDRGYFPPYEAVVIARRDSLSRVPGAREALLGLGGVLSTEQMRRLNYEVDGKKRDVAEVVRGWRRTGHVEAQ